MKLFFLCLLTCLCFSGCSKNEIFEPENNLEEIETKSGGDGVYDLLGYGYDVTEQYYHPSSSKNKVINTVALKKDYPNRVEMNLSSSNSGKIFVGTTAEDYTKEVTAYAKIGVSIPVFGGNLSANFSYSQLYSSRFSIAEYNLIIRKKQLFYNAPISILSQYVTAEFMTDVNKQSPDYIIKNYGTHVLTNIILGGRLNVMYRSYIESSASSKKEAVTVGVSSGVKKIFSVDAGGTINESIAKKNTEEMLVYQTVGGDPSKAIVGALSLTPESNTKIDIKAWQESCNISNVALVDAQPETAIPIYEFVENASKKEALKKALNDYYLRKKFVDVNSAVPFYRYHNVKSKDHFYTTNWSELGKGKDGYAYEWIAGYIYTNSSSVKGLVPLYQYYDEKNKDHFYTTDWSELQQGKDKYVYEKIAGYVFPSSSRPNGTVPMYRYWDSQSVDHFYTTDWSELQQGKDKYVYEWVACNIFPVEAPK